MTNMELNFNDTDINPDTDRYIREPETLGYNHLILRSISTAVRNGRTPREF